MTSLIEWQREFMSALTADRPLPASTWQLGDDAGTRFAIYRNNRRSNLRNALRLTYPVTLQLVGEEFFGYAADCFINAHPSRSANLDAYGREFPQYLRNFAPAQGLPYLGDVAALEAAIEAIAAAADGGAQVRLQSPFPILRIWQSNQPGWHDDGEIDLGAGGDDLLVRLQCGEVVIEKMRRL